MKLVSAALGVLVVLLLAAMLHTRQKTSLLEAEIASFARDRENMKGELQKLNTRLIELQKRAVVTTTAGAAPAATAAGRTETVAPPPAPVARPGVTIAAPPGWHKNGAKADQYVVGVDSTETWGGMPSAYVESLVPAVAGGFGGMMQTTAAENYAGKRVRLSGWIKTENANEGGGHLWLRIDGQERGQMLGFDNMSNRSVKGTRDWQEAAIVLDVPPGASALAYGFFVSGGGKMWVNGQRIEEVGQDVPTTNMLSNKALPTTPRNLGFDPNQPK